MSNTEVKANPKYKDHLFRKIFGGENEESKRNLLSLYNALNDSHYENIDELEITTMEEALYIKMKNDVSFLLDSYLSLWEHQSTFNPNMPIRGLMYFGNLYDKYIKVNNINIYGKKLAKIPNPKYIVFYNGSSERPSIEDLKLSSAFMNKDSSGDFEWTATVYNLNKGKNESLLAKCKPLADYMELINRIRSAQKKGLKFVNAVTEAVDSCIKDGIMSEYLSDRKSEVMDVVITEYDEKALMEGFHAEGKEEGLVEGIAKGRLEQLVDLVKDGLIKVADAARKSGMSEEEFKLLLK